MDRLTQLQSRYLELTNKVLPQIAKERQFPVRYNHCFGRIILDNLFGCCWYEVLERKQGAAFDILPAVNGRGFQTSLFGFPLSTS